VGGKEPIRGDDKLALVPDIGTVEIVIFQFRRHAKLAMCDKYVICH